MKKFRFYLEQLVTYEDLNDVQANIEEMFSALIADIGIPYAYQGLAVEAPFPASLAVKVMPGRAYFDNGAFGVLSNQQLLSVASTSASELTAVTTVGYQRWVSIWLVPTEATDTPVVTPEGPTINYRSYGIANLYVTMGVEQVHPVRPALDSVEHGVLLCDILLNYGQSTVIANDMHFDRVLSDGSSGRSNANIKYLLNGFNTHTTHLGVHDDEISDAQDAILALQTYVLGLAAASHTHSATDITTGVLDPARIPVLPMQEQVFSSGDLAALTSEQQDDVVKSVVVVTTDGKRWIYTGTGSKTNPASYIEMSDVTPAWDVITGKPSNIGVPVGSVTAYAGPTIPSGWYECDGSTKSRTEDSDLYAAIGVTWGVGDGSTTFTLPDFRGKSLIGAGIGAVDATVLTNRVLGTEGGREETTDLIEHSHAPQWTGNVLGSIGGGDRGDNMGNSGAYSMLSNELDSAGTVESLDLMNPFGVIKWIIKK